METTLFPQNLDISIEIHKKENNIATNTVRLLIMVTLNIKVCLHHFYSPILKSHIIIMIYSWLSRGQFFLYFQGFAEHGLAKSLLSMSHEHRITEATITSILLPPHSAKL
jgi:cell division protein ZapA (FtsZ GTPase activity inhibitor)